MLALLAVLAVAVVVAVTIANRGPRIEGVWKVTEYHTAGNGGIWSQGLDRLNAMGRGITMTFRQGKLTVTADALLYSDAWESSYQVKGYNLILDDGMLKISITNDTMTLMSRMETLILVRQ